MTCNTHTHWVNIHDFKCIYVIQYESTHAWSALILAPKKIENKKLHFIIKGQISMKTAIVREWLENNQVLSFPSGFRDLKNDRIWCCRFFQTEQTVNRKKSGFRAALVATLLFYLELTLRLPLLYFFITYYYFHYRYVLLSLIYHTLVFLKIGVSFSEFPI